MDGRNIRDSAFESVDVEEDGSEATSNNDGDTSLDLLEQQQAREQARLLQRFRELRQWQQKQQEQLMQQQHLQLEMLKGEQLRVQTLIASQRGAQWGDGRVSRPEGAHRSPPLMTPPRRSAGAAGGELAKTMRAALPHTSADSGLVASMGDTLDPHKMSLPLPVMLPSSPTLDEDKYTNPELFSNPGSHSDDLQAVDDRFPAGGDAGSEVSSDNFYLPPLPPERGEGQGDLAASLNMLQGLMGTSAPNLLQQVLGLLPAQQKSLLLEKRQAAVQESASPTFSPVHPSTSHPAAPSASAAAAVPSSVTHSQGPRSAAPSAAAISGGVHAGLQPPVRAPGFPPTTAFLPGGFGQGQRLTLPPGVQDSVGGPGFGHHHSVPLNSGQSLLYGEQQRLAGLPQADLAQSRGKHPETDRLYMDYPAMDRLQSQVSYPQTDPTQSHAGYSQMEHFHPASRQPAQRETQFQQHVPLQPQVTTRASWEDEEREEGRRRREDVREASDSEMEEEAEQEELEVTVKAANNFDDVPITTGLQGRKTFEQLLEEQLASEGTQEEEDQPREETKPPSGPVKRPFLRKGQGIARFSQPIKRPPPKRSSGHKGEPPRSTATGRSGGSTMGADAERPAAPVKSTLSKRQPERKRAGVGKKQVRDEDPPQPEKLKLIKMKSESGKKTAAPKLQNSGNQGKPSVAVFPSRDEEEEKEWMADDASFVARLKEREKKEPLEAEELDEFEALEDIADNMSLVSNSSVVQRLITPNKQRQKSAVSDLKTVLEKKKNGPASPFERNAAIRSLMSINPHLPPVHHPQDLRTAADHVSTEQVLGDTDDTPVEDRADTGTRCDPRGHSVSAVTKQRELQDLPEMFSGGDVKSVDTVNGVLPHSAFGEMQGTSGFTFSKQFSFFDAHRQGSEIPDQAPLSPTKSVTRKVATLQSRLTAANDTASLLQKLSAHAGFLSSGLSKTESGDPAPGLERGVARREEEEEEGEGGNDQSLLSSSVSRPQPLVIGGTRTEGFESGLTATLPTESKAESDEDSSDNTLEDDDDEEEEGDVSDENRQTKGYSLAAGGDVGMDTDVNSNNINNNSNKDGDEGWEDEEEWTSNAPQVLDNQLAGQTDLTGTADTSTPPTSRLMTRLFPKLKPKPTVTQQQQQQKMEMATTASVGEGIQSKVLREKLAELESEIEKFRSENAALEKLRKEREEGLKKLKEEIARFDHEKTEELRRLEEFKSQETRKLKQERKLFEAYQKQVRSMPDKKDREEIEALKRQLSDLQDEMKRKEGRWASSTTRLKTRIVELEGENNELREEMKLLERKRLEWMQSRSAHRPAQSQPSTTVKSTPRSSTPTNERTTTTTSTNGFHSAVAPVFDGGHSRGASHPAASSGPVAMTTHVNGAGPAGKNGPTAGGHNGSGGESMPRDQPATPSMIEGVSPAALANGGDGSESFLMTSAVSSSSKVVDRPSVDKGNGQYEETQYSDGKVERVYSNGSREVLFANGTRKEISSDGQYFIVSFFNGDIKQVFPDQRVVYYYAESQTTHTTYPDRLEVLQFPNNQTEKHYPDGTHEITFPNQTVKYLFPNGTEESIFPDGTILRIDKNGEKVLEFPNGQREIHTQQHKRREYPDGTVKTLHNDGRQETRYATGRIRLKDKDGNVILDRMC